MTKDIPSIFAQVKRFEPTIKELRVFHGKTEVSNEATHLNLKINDMLNVKDKVPEVLQPIVQILSEHGIPVTQFPNV